MGINRCASIQHCTSCLPGRSFPVAVELNPATTALVYDFEQTLTLQSNLWKTTTDLVSDLLPIDLRNEVQGNASLINRRFGRARSAFEQALWATLSLGNIDRLTEEQMDDASTGIASGIRLRDGVPEMLQRQLDAGYRVGIVSFGVQEPILKKLKSVNLPVDGFEGSGQSIALFAPSLSCSPQRNIPDFDLTGTVKKLADTGEELTPENLIIHCESSDKLTDVLSKVKVTPSTKGKVARNFSGNQRLFAVGDSIVDVSLLSEADLALLICNEGEKLVPDGTRVLKDALLNVAHKVISTSIGEDPIQIINQLIET